MATSKVCSIEGCDKRSAKIYVLRDPRNGAIRYVGCTSQRYISSRLAQHLNDDLDTPKQRWIRELQAHGVYPLIEMIEIVPQNEGLLAEQRCIDRFRADGLDILNVYQADLSEPRPEISRQKISDFRKSHVGWKHAEETKAKIGRAGSRNSQAKLTEADIPQIRALVVQGLSYRKIGERFGIVPQTVYDIVHGRIWRNVL